MLLTACGGSGGGGGSVGGGGGSSTGSSGGFDVKFSKAQLLENLPSIYDSFTIDVTTSGDPGVSNVYVESSFSGEGIERVQMSLGATYGSLYIYPKHGLWSGDYSGNITVKLCRDSSCAKQLAKSPYTIAYTFHNKNIDWRMEPTSGASVKKFIRNYNEEQLYIYTQEGISNQKVHMRVELPDGGTSIEFDDSTIETLKISNITNTGFDFLPPDLPVSSTDKSFYVNVKMTDGNSLPIGLRITQFVAPPNVDTTKFSFTQPSVSLKVPYANGWTDGTKLPFFLPFSDCVASGFKEPTLSVEYISGQDWLNTNPFTADVSVTQKDYPIGHYEAKVTGESCNHEKSSIMVTLDVYSGYVIFTDTIARFYDQIAEFQSPKSMRVYATNDVKNYQWQVSTSDEGFFFVENTSGGTSPLGDEFKYQWDKNFIKALPNSQTYEGHIQISDPSGSLDPVTLTVTAEKYLPQAISLSPSIIETGKEFELTITGENLDNQYFNFWLSPVENNIGGSGFVQPSLTLISQSKTKVVVRVGALQSAGDYEIVFPSVAELESDYMEKYVPRIQLKVINPIISKGSSFILKNINDIK